MIKFTPRQQTIKKAERLPARLIAGFLEKGKGGVRLTVVLKLYARAESQHIIAPFGIAEKVHLRYFIIEVYRQEKQVEADAKIGTPGEAVEIIDREVEEIALGNPQYIGARYAGLGAQPEQAYAHAYGQAQAFDGGFVRMVKVIGVEVVIHQAGREIIVMQARLNIKHTPAAAEIDPYIPARAGFGIEILEFGIEGREIDAHFRDDAAIIVFLGLGR